MAEQLKFTPVIQPCKAPGMFWGYIQEVSGVVTDGTSIEQVEERLQQQLDLYLEYLSKHEPAEMLQLLRKQTNQLEQWDYKLTRSAA